MSAIQWNPKYEGTPAPEGATVGSNATVVHLSEWRRDRLTENNSGQSAHETVNSISGLFRHPSANLVPAGQPTSTSALLLDASRRNQIEMIATIVRAELRAA